VPATIVLVAGLALVLAYVLLVAWSDGTAGDPKALERRLGVPVVATIPKLVSSRGF
jgi:capsular polysaccharide biosynthesis protein